MELAVFEALCVPVILVALAQLARARPWREVALDYALLALASLAGEASCIAFYGHYAYASGWHARVLAVPLLVPLIWPLVVLSGREVARSLFPGATPALTGLVVALDASLVEVVAVRAGLWSWSEPGHQGVPLAGIAGWGFFAASAALWLETPPKVRWLTVVMAPLLTHVMIVASWWALFRWTLRGDLGVASVIGVGVVGVALSAVALARRRAGRTLPAGVALPRVLAAALFFALLALTGDVPLWVHAGAVAVPYLIVSKPR
jgi:hypothetical protein